MSPKRVPGKKARTAVAYECRIPECTERGRDAGSAAPICPVHRIPMKPAAKRAQNR